MARSKPTSVKSSAARAPIENKRNFVESFARGLVVIQSFNNEPEGITSARISKKTGLDRATVRRLLLTLENLGFAESYGSVHRLRPSILRLGFSYLSSSTLPSLAQPILQEISREVHESTSLSALDGDDIIYLARHMTSRVLSVGLSVGSRLPAYCTSMGRVLLASLPKAQLDAFLARSKFKRMTNKTVTKKSELMRILKQAAIDGYCLVDGELEPGLRSIAVPVRARGGRTVAAMNVGAHATNVSIEDMTKKILPVLRERAELLSRLL